MKSLCLVALAFTMMACQSEPQARLVEEWSTKQVMKTPESILYLPEMNTLFVANINGTALDVDGNGFISTMTPGGEINQLEWVTGMNAPKGMGYFKGKLYVTDITELIEIDIDSAKIVKRYPAEGAIFLNDIAIDDSGTVYVSDFSPKNSAIYRLNADGFQKWLYGPEITEPNGMLIMDNKLVFGNTGDRVIKAVNLSDGSISEVVDPGIGADGLRAFGESGFIISDWTGLTAMVDMQGNVTKLLDTRDEKINSADLEFIPDKNIVLIPTFFDNRVVAYRLIKN